VAYLNTSTQVTTGSALVFDGANLGLGGTTNTYGSQTTLTLSGSVVSRIDFRSNGVFTGTLLSYQSVTEGLRLSTEAGYPITFYPAGTEAMRIGVAAGGVGAVGIGYTTLTSVGNNGLAVLGNVGIGTSSPQGSLDVTATGATVNQFLTGGAGNNLVTGIFRIGSGLGRGASIQGFRGASSNVHSLDFYTYNSADVFGMRLDSSGNLGIGTASPTSRLHVSSSNGDVAKIAGTTRSLVFGADSVGMMLSTGASQTGVGTYYAAGSDFMYFMTGSTERARFNSTGAFVFAGGTTTADGIGITFPATQSASANANTLDDYEEGTWTYDFTATTGTITKSTTYPLGLYTKIGRQVTITGFLAVTSVSSPTGTLTLTGLPFPITTASDRANFVGSGIFGSSLSAGSVSPLMVSGSAGNSSLTISKFVTGSTASLAGDVVADTRFQISFTYFTD
jgi:hypothetical protein